MTDKDADESFKVEGRQVVEFPLLDEQAQQELIRCIQTKGRIKIVIKDLGQIDLGRGTSYRQLID